MISSTHFLSVFAVLTAILYYFSFIQIPDNTANSSHLSANHTSNSASFPEYSGYIILIDAGSSGTRIHIFSYNSPTTVQTNNSNLPIIHPSKSLKVKPGLSFYEHQPELSAQSLLPLLEFAKNSLNQSLWYTTPIYLLATAGLRSLNSFLAAEILNQCRLVLKQYPFNFSPNNVRLISGVEEGINGWIATNYLLGNFQQTNNTNTVGLLEMGGASFQITYAPSNLSLFNNNQNFPLLPVKIANTHYQVFTASYLNYGLDKAQALYISLLSNQLSLNGDPCFPKSLNNGKGNYLECLELVDTLISLQKEHHNNTNIQINDNKHSNNNHNNNNQNNNNKFNNEEKQKEIEFTMQQQKEHELYVQEHSENVCKITDDHTNNNNNNKICKFGGFPVPPIQPSDHFLAIENFFYTSEFFSLLNHSHIVKGLREAGENFCQLEWDVIVQKYPKEPKNDLEKYCFSSAYLVRVLEIGLGYAGFETENIIELDTNIENENIINNLVDREDDRILDNNENAIELIETLEQIHVPKEVLVATNSSVYRNIRFLKFVNGIQLDWAIGAVLQLITDHLHRGYYHNTTSNIASLAH